MVALLHTILVHPLNVKNQINNTAQIKGRVTYKLFELMFANQVKTLTLVGILIMIVAALKYIFESVSILAEYM